MVAFNRDSLPKRVLFTVVITANGNLLSWHVRAPDGAVLEDWTTSGGPEAHRYTWEMGVEAYIVLRDVMKFMGEEDWTPGKVM